MSRSRPQPQALADKLKSASGLGGGGVVMSAADAVGVLTNKVTYAPLKHKIALAIYQHSSYSSTAETTLIYRYMSGITSNTPTCAQKHQSAMLLSSLYFCAKNAFVDMPLQKQPKKAANATKPVNADPHPSLEALKKQLEDRVEGQTIIYYISIFRLPPFSSPTSSASRCDTVLSVSSIPFYLLLYPM